MLEFIQWLDQVLRNEMVSKSRSIINFFSTTTLLASNPSQGQFYMVLDEQVSQSPFSIETVTQKCL